MKFGDAETSEMGVVNTAVEEENKESVDKPSDTGDVDQYVDFQGSDHFNVGTCDDEPDEDDPFGFSGISFGEFKLGVEFADVCGLNAPPQRPSP